MSTYSQLISSVNTLTKRPDLVDDTALAIKQATIQAHSSDFYPKDLFETGISFTTSDYRQSLNYKLLLPLWRSLKYLRKYDAVNLAAGAELKAIPTEKVVDSYGAERNDVIYLAGQVYQIKSSTQEQYYLLGAYLHPDTNPDTYTSWIAEECPLLIAYKAASIVAGMIGNTEMKTNHEREASILMDQIHRANIGSIIGE